MSKSLDDITGDEDSNEDRIFGGDGDDYDLVEVDGEVIEDEGEEE